MTVQRDEWWRSAVIYMVYIRSFRDGNGDGIGDLPGLLTEVDHIASLGVDAVWISPFFKSPMKDFGYDVADYREVDPIFGTMADFDAVLAAFHARNIRVLLDLVVSHTSDQHDWFSESRLSRSGPKADWYVWADPKSDGSPPSNWLSLFGGSAWQWEPQRGQYYLHNFLRSQPDLNYHTPQVQDAILDVFEFWLERGVDGFRLDVVNFYVHDRHLQDNPPVPADADLSTVPVSNPYGRQLHLHDKNQPENLVFLERLRRLMRRYGDAFLLGELGVDEEVPEWTRRYTQACERLHTAYTFELLAAKEPDPVHIRNVVSAMDRGMGNGWTAWSLSNLDNPRVVSRWHAEDCPDRAAPLF
ncbi:MAG: alpha-glucosidase, partial [Mesorhizobium sp.]